MYIQWTDNQGYPIERFIGKPFKSFFRVICQIIRGNVKITIGTKLPYKK